MKACTCFLLITIFAYTISSPLHSPKADKRDINIDLDLEGALELNVVQNSITVSDKKLIGYKKIGRRDLSPPRVETFTGFIFEVIKVLYTYDDNTFEDFFHILDKEIRNDHYRGFKFHELTENNEIRNLLADKFGFAKGKSIRDLAEIIQHKVNDKNVKPLLNYVNSIYREDAREKFRKVLTDLTAYGNSNNKDPNNDLAKIISHGFFDIFINHYTNLDAKEKRGLKKEIIVFLKGLTEDPSASSTANFVSPKPAISKLNSNIIKYVTTKVKKPEIDKKSDPTSTAVQNKAINKRRQIHKQQLSNEVSENEETIPASSKEESDSQQLVLTFVSTEETYHESSEGHSRETSTDESSDATVHESSLELAHDPRRKLISQPYDTLHIEDFYKTTEKPQIIINKSDMKSKSAERMSTEGSTDRLPTERLNTKRFRYRTTAHPSSKQTKKYVFRRARPSQTTARFIKVDYKVNLHDKEFRKSIAPPMPNEELSLEGFDREKNKIEEALAKSYSLVNKNSIKHGLKDYIKRRRHLDKTINELKQEYNQLSRINVSTNNGDKVKNTTNDSEAKDKIHNDTNNRTEDGNIKETKVFSERQSIKHEMRAQTEKNEKASNTENAGNETKLFNKDENDVEKKKETVNSHEKNFIKLKRKKNVKKSGSKKATKKTQTTDTRDKFSTEAKETPIKLNTSSSLIESVKSPVFLELPQTAKEKNNLSNLFTEDEHDKEKNRENVKILDKKILKLKNMKKAKRIGSKKATKTAKSTDTRDEYTTEAMKTSELNISIIESVQTPVFLGLLPTTNNKNNLTETTSEATVQVFSATLNFNKEIIVKNNATTVNIDKDTRGKLKLNVIVTPSTRRHRRVLQYSSPPF